MAGMRTPYERAMVLAAVSGLKTTLGPALVAASSKRQGWKGLALAAMGEMVLDKLPFLPSRRSLPLLLPRAIAGYWSAKTYLESEGVEDQGAAAMGAAVAAGVATFAPIVRGAASKVLGVPDPLIGLGEDWLALKFGGEAAGLSMEELGELAKESVEGLQEQVAPMLQDAREKLMPTS